MVLAGGVNVNEIEPFNETEDFKDEGITFAGNGNTTSEEAKYEN